MEDYNCGYLIDATLIVSTKNDTTIYQCDTLILINSKKLTIK